MDIIDFHTHVFPDELAGKAVRKLTESAPGMHNRTDGTLAGLRDSMRKNGIRFSVTLPVATKPSQVQGINSDLSTGNRDDVIRFGTLHPDSQPVHESVARLAECGVRGIKLHPEYQDFFVDDRKMYPLYEELSFHGLILIVHAGKDPGPFTGDHALPRALRTVVRDFPSLRLVAAHMGGWKVWDDVHAILAGENLYFDTAAACGFMEERAFVRLVKKHGVSRILFGSDSPWYDQGEIIRWIEGTPLSSAEKEAVLSGNARRLLALP